MNDVYSTTKRSENHLDQVESVEMAEEEGEEALSLSGLILNSDETETTPPVTDYSNTGRNRSSSEPSDFFEFFSEINSSEISHAEDIIFCGKLMPFNNYKEQPGQTNRCDNRKHRVTEGDKYLQSFVHRRRSESMSELNSTINIRGRRRSNSTNSNLMIKRSSRSLDYQRLYGKSDKMLEIQRSLSAKSSGSKTDLISIKEKVITPSKPRWYFLTFGLVKFPPEMALRDIKNRQVRRNSGSLFSSSHSGERDLTHKYDRRSSWDDLLKLLSCKDDASVAVTTTPFGCLQHA